MEIEEETFEVNGSTDLPTSNLLEKGRYKFSVNDITNFTSQAGNKCVKVTLLAEGKKIFDIFLTEGQMSWKWRQFLYAIDIREKGTHFSITKSKILGGTGLVDVIQKDRTLDDGSIIKENKISYYSPIKIQTAPIVGVEPEDEPEISVPVEDDL